MKKLLLCIGLILSMGFYVSAQVNLIKNGDFEEQGVWQVKQTSLIESVSVEFGATNNTLAGGDGGNIEISFKPEAVIDAQVWVYQAVEVEAEKEYTFNGAFRDISAELGGCFWQNYFYAYTEPVEGADITEKGIVIFHPWGTGKPNRPIGFDGMLDTAIYLWAPEIDRTLDAIITFPETGTLYVGLNFGMCDAVGDYTFLFDNLELIDPDGEPVGVNDLKANKLKLSCYPNPTAEKINFTYSISENSKVEIALTNILGETVATRASGSKHKGTYTETFDCSNLASGLYYGTLKVDNKNTITKKIIVAK